MLRVPGASAEAKSADDDESDDAGTEEERCGADKDEDSAAACTRVCAWG